MRCVRAVEVAGRLLTLTVPMAVRSVLEPETIGGEQVGLASMRTAGLALPPVKHLADAGDLRDLLREDGVARRRTSAAAGRVSEVSARIRMGGSAGLILR